MDPVSLALITAVGAGVTSSMTDVTKATLVSAYTALKNRLLTKFESHADLAHAVAKLEAAPDSQARQGIVLEEVTAAHADQDAELLQLAQALLGKLRDSGVPSQFIQKVEGNYNAITQQGNSSVSIHSPLKDRSTDG